jgi:type IV secretory pathway component VirB8
MWIWIGAHVLLIGTIVAMVPSTKPRKYAVGVKQREAVEAVKTGALVSG